MLPPYTKALSCADGSEVGATARIGQLFAMRPSGDISDESILDAIAGFRRDSPATTLVLWLDRIGTDRVAMLVAMCRTFGVRAFVLAPELSAESIRAQLTSRQGLASDVAVWVRARVHDLPHSAEDLLKRLVEHAPFARNLKDIAHTVGPSESSWRRGFNAARLGPPAAWFQLLRALTVCMELQGRPEASIAEIARNYGYYDASALRQRCADVTGFPIPLVRTVVGIEPLLYYGCRRNGLLRGLRRQAAVAPGIHQAKSVPSSVDAPYAR